MAEEHVVFAHLIKSRSDTSKIRVATIDETLVDTLCMLYDGYSEAVPIVTSENISSVCGDFSYGYKVKFSQKGEKCELYKEYIKLDSSLDILDIPEGGTVSMLSTCEYADTNKNTMIVTIFIKERLRTSEIRYLGNYVRTMFIKEDFGIHDEAPRTLEELLAEYREIHPMGDNCNLSFDEYDNDGNLINADVEAKEELHGPEIIGL